MYPVYTLEEQAYRASLYIKNLGEGETLFHPPRGRTLAMEVPRVYDGDAVRYEELKDFKRKLIQCQSWAVQTGGGGGGDGQSLQGDPDRRVARRTGRVVVAILGS